MRGKVRENAKVVGFFPLSGKPVSCRLRLVCANEFSLFPTVYFEPKINFLGKLVNLIRRTLGDLFRVDLLACICGALLLPAFVVTFV